ncbi:MAG: hypothetical protein ACLRG2_05710 [Pauljensenia sp.]
MTASPNGTLTDAVAVPTSCSGTGCGPGIPQEGFVVCEDAVPFLEEKLALLGLTTRRRDFITTGRRASARQVHLRVFRASSYSPRPLQLHGQGQGRWADTFIRVFMTIRGGGDHGCRAGLQPGAQRTGLVAVEWGGTEDNSHL